MDAAGNLEPQVVSCTSCGGEVPVATKAARVASCPYCENLLIVNEEAVRSLGKMALLAETPSCLAVGWRARCLGREIEVLGRIQYRYRSGLWDEWWVRFADDGSYGWISQDEGEYMLERPLPERVRAPEYDRARPGDRFSIGRQKLWVEEKDEAVMVGLQGELPRDVRPGGTMRYLDLTDNKRKVTFEYFADGSREGFVGQYLKPRDLIALDRDEEASAGRAYPAPKLEHPPGKEAGKVVRTEEGVRPQVIHCVSCGGSVELRDRQAAAMVVCQFCGSALDVSQPGSASLLYESEKRKLDAPLKIGARGRLQGAEWTVIGRVRYRELDPSGHYVWDEFQLFNPDGDYAFLALENGHWTLFKPLRRRLLFQPASARPKQKFVLDGQTFTVMERSRAEITYVEGELSWVARLGDQLGYMDAIRPPQMLSAEWTANEMEWSIGRYVPREEVARAFGLKTHQLPSPKGVAPAQPFGQSKDGWISAWSGLAVTLFLLLLAMVTWLSSRGEPVLSTGPIPSSAYLSESGHVSEPFEIPAGNHTCKLEAVARSVDNAWVALSVAVLDEEENVALDAEATVEYFHGVEGGESWSEGSREDYTLFRLTGPKTYRLNVFGSAGVWSQTGGDRQTHTGAPVELTLYRDVLPARYFLYAAVLAAIFPIWEFGRRVMFEARRWPSDDD
jgi:predicted RNA-binding Zn-ribbon protein involved in translation (DUF1610 family)